MIPSARRLKTSRIGKAILRRHDCRAAREHPDASRNLGERLIPRKDAVKPGPSSEHAVRRNDLPFVEIGDRRRLQVGRQGAIDHAQGDCRPQRPRQHSQQRRIRDVSGSWEANVDDIEASPERRPQQAYCRQEKTRPAHGRRLPERQSNDALLHRYSSALLQPAQRRYRRDQDGGDAAGAAKVLMKIAEVTLSASRAAQVANNDHDQSDLQPSAPDCRTTSLIAASKDTNRLSSSLLIAEMSAITSPSRCSLAGSKIGSFPRQAPTAVAICRMVKVSGDATLIAGGPA